MADLVVFVVLVLMALVVLAVAVVVIVVVLVSVVVVLPVMPFLPIVSVAPVWGAALFLNYSYNGSRLDRYSFGDPALVGGWRVVCGSGGGVALLFSSFLPTFPLSNFFILVLFGLFRLHPLRPPLLQ